MTPADSGRTSKKEVIPIAIPWESSSHCFWSPSKYVNAGNDNKDQLNERFVLMSSEHAMWILAILFVHVQVFIVDLSVYSIA